MGGGGAGFGIMRDDQPITLGIRFGYHGSVAPLVLRPEDRRQHLEVIGRSGTGKSTLLLRMIEQDITAGRGFAVIDPHGALAEAVLDMVPPQRTWHVRYFNPADTDYPIGLNLFDRVPTAWRHLAVSGVAAAFKSIWPESIFDRSMDILINTTQALMEIPGTTLLSIPKMLKHPEYRRFVVGRIEDPVLKDFWLNEYETRGDRFNTEADAPILNKVRRFLTTPLVRNIVGQRTTAIDFRYTMDNRRIFIANLSKGTLGANNATLLEAILVNCIELAALERATVAKEARAELPDFTLYIDEFQNLATESFSQTLSEIRKYKLSVVLAHQFFGQISPAVRSAILANVGSMVAFRIGQEDAEIVAKEFQHDFTPDELTSLPNHHVCARLMEYDEPSVPYTGRTEQPTTNAFRGSSDAIVRFNRKRYSHPREKVERWITEFLGGGDDGDDVLFT